MKEKLNAKKFPAKALYPIAQLRTGGFIHARHLTAFSLLCLADNSTFGIEPK